jgi:osmotically-inducible protein OsmY
MEPGASADEALARLVGDAIQREPGVVRNLVVRVGDGVVTLRGTTLSEADKARIIMQTRTVPGVVRVVDEIVVEQ